MNSRRSFLRSLCAAVAMAPALCRLGIPKEFSVPGNSVFWKKMMTQAAAPINPIKLSALMRDAVGNPYFCVNGILNKTIVQNVDAFNANP